MPAEKRNLFSKQKHSHRLARVSRRATTDGGKRGDMRAGRPALMEVIAGLGAVLPFYS